MQVTETLNEGLKRGYNIVVQQMSWPQRLTKNWLKRGLKLK